MAKAVRVNDNMAGSVSHHAGHIIGWQTIDDVDVPIYCNGHSVQGSQTMGARKTNIEGKKAARVGDIGDTNCQCDGNGYTITTGSSKVRIEGKPAARSDSRCNIHGHGNGHFTSYASKVRIG